MTDFENRIPEDEAMIEEWPNPEEDYMGDYDNEDDWDDYTDEPEGPMDYAVRFKLVGATEEEVSDISRYLFRIIEKELKIHYSKLVDLEIEED